MKYALLFCFVLSLISCWKDPVRPYYPNRGEKVWGSKPVYASIEVAKKILYDPAKHSIVAAGNIYAYNNYLFQVDVGRGIHVIDNTIPSKADRIGFITINGCSQVSIRGSYLYTNCFTDLVTINIADPLQMKIESTVKNAFPDMYVNYPLIQPEEPGYYECPRYDSIVVNWVKDSVYKNCYKN